MEIIDISWPIAADMTQYKDKKRLSVHAHHPNDYMTEHTVSMHNHVGTHIDAPQHVVPDGTSIDRLPLQLFYGCSYVIDCTQVTDCITAEILQRCDIPEHSRILLKTRNSMRAGDAAFDHDFVFVHASAAQWLVEKKVILIGIDYLGIERSQPDHATHKIFAHAGVPILEGLRLQDVHAGTYTLAAFPLNFIGLDAAVTRAVLIKT